MASGDGKQSRNASLEALTYEVSRRNVRTPYGEIDIVAHKNGIVYFVEVKTLTSSKEFFPEHQITARKLEHMLNSASHYAAENGVEQWQIDVIAIEGKPGSEVSIQHFENIQ